MPSSEKLKRSDVPEKSSYLATKRPLYYIEHRFSIRNNPAQLAWLGSHSLANCADQRSQLLILQILVYTKVFSMS